MLKIDLDGKNALVTGASQGIGKAIAAQLAEAGAKVAIHHFSHTVDTKDFPGPGAAIPGRHLFPGTSQATVQFRSGILRAPGYSRQQRRPGDRFAARPR